MNRGSSSSEWQLTAAEFNAACAGRRFTERGRQIAYEQLVEGTPPEVVATRYRISRNRAFVLRKQVYSAHLEASNYPPDWVTATLTAPPDALRAFQKQVGVKLRAWREFKAADAAHKAVGRSK